MKAETNRFILRELDLNDIENIFELDSDPEVHTYLGNNPMHYISQAEDTVSHVIQQYSDYGIGRWAIISKEDGSFIGWTGLKYETKPVYNNNAYYDLGFRIMKKYWGQGIATETGSACLSYGFETMDLKKICAAAHINNEGSNKTLAKIGMKFIENFYYLDIPCKWYALSQEDYFCKENNILT